MSQYGCGRAEEGGKGGITFAREMERKQTDISMPLMVTWPSPNLMPER